MSVLVDRQALTWGGRTLSFEMPQDMGSLLSNGTHRAYLVAGLLNEDLGAELSAHPVSHFAEFPQNRGPTC